MIVNDLIGRVIDKLRGRDDLVSRIPNYIKQAILDLTESNQFEELVVPGPISNFIINQAEYPIKGYDPLGVNGNPFINQDDTKITFIISWYVWFVDSGAFVQGQSTGLEMKNRSLRVVEPMSKILGQPVCYCTSGTEKNKGRIIVGFMPNDTYQTQMRYQREHPFPGTNTNSSALLHQYIYMPDDWAEIIVYAAAEKGCDDLGMYDVSLKYHQKIFGYKDKYGSETPGLIMARKTDEQRNSFFNERALKPIVRRYT